MTVQPSPRLLVPEDAFRAGRPAELFWRSIACAVRDQTVMPDKAVAKAFGNGSDGRLLDVITRAAHDPAYTATSTWASELIQTTNAAWVSSLVSSVYSQLAARGGLSLSFDGGQVRVPGRDATPTVAGAFIAEGAPFPVKALGLSSTILRPKKLGVLVTFSGELWRMSQPNVEQVVKSEVVADTSVAVDGVLLSNVAATTIAPGGIRAGVTGLTATAGGGTAAMIGDVKQLTAGIGAAAAPVLIANPQQAASLIAYYREGVSVIASPNVSAGMLIAVDAASFATASSLPTFKSAIEAVLHMDDAATAITSGAGPTAAALTNIAAPVRSLFQSDSVALRMTWPLDWTLRRAGSVAWLSGATW